VNGKAELQNRPSYAAWSATRARTFQDCRRKYYYRYHLAPLARKPDAPAEAYEAERLKDLVGLEAWAGDLVHAVIQTILNRWRAGRDCPPSEVEAFATKLLSRQFRDSHEFWHSHPDAFPRRPTLLDLHYYRDGEVSKERAAAIKETVLHSLRSFTGSDLARQIRRAGPARWLPIDRNAAAKLPGDVLILVKPDFAFRDGDRLHILDWKTGRPDPFWETVQAVCYALYAAEQWHTSLGQVVPQIVHLYPQFSISENELNAENLGRVELFIRESQEQILSLVEPGGPADPERFPFTEECGRCRWCQFRGICDGATRQ
jgi:hypothetical protein